MKILIIGANGYTGARLYTDLKIDFQVTGTYHNQLTFPELIKLDLYNELEISRVILENHPDVILCVANNPNNKWCMENPDLATKLNVLSTQYIVNAANHIHAKVIYISTVAAKASNTEPYPASKYKSEEIVKTNQAGYIIIRPVVIFGYSPNTNTNRPFNKYVKALLNKNLTESFDNVWKFQPTYIGQMSEIIKEVINRNIINETIPVSVFESKTFYEIAVDLLSPFNIKVEATNAYNRPSYIDDLAKLKELKLPIYTYKEVIQKIITEFKNFQCNSSSNL